MSLGVCWFPCHTTELLMTVLFFICEYYNYYCHYQLWLLWLVEKDGKIVLSKKWEFPKGKFFDDIISPNYTFEILAWVVFVFLSGSYMIFLFISLGSYIMYVWAAKKKWKLLESDNITE